MNFSILSMNSRQETRNEFLDRLEMNHDLRIRNLRNFFNNIKPLMRKRFLSHLDDAEKIYDEDTREKVICQYELYIRSLDLT